MKLIELLSVLSHYQFTGSLKDIKISGIEIDHRVIKSGDLFISISGFTVDGHHYAERAVSLGAVAVIGEKNLKLSVPTIIVPDSERVLALLACKFYGFPSNQLSLVGVTGTNGKTTTTYLLDNIFKYHGKKTGLIGTIQLKIGNESYEVQNTTPNALLLQKTLRQMKDENVEVVCMEVSSHAIDLGRIYGCNYDIVVFTNLSQDHLDYHRNIDEYLRVKSLLFAQLGNTYTSNMNKFAIINEDDTYSHLIKRSTAHHVLTYGYKEKADIMAINVELSLAKTRFILKTPLGSVEIISKLVGMFNVYNMLAASSVAIAANIPLSTIQIALKKMTCVEGRFEQITENQDYGVIVDYAHTPDSLENVLQTITEFVKGKIYVIIGCGGDRDRLKRPKMADVALKYADHAIFTSDNPRTEDPNVILQEMTGHLKQTHYEVVVDRKRAIEKAIKQVSEGDVVLIAGKGHENYQEINHIKYVFDDRIVAKEAIKNKELK